MPGWAKVKYLHRCFATLKHDNLTVSHISFRKTFPLSPFSFQFSPFTFQFEKGYFFFFAKKKYPFSQRDTSNIY